MIGTEPDTHDDLSHVPILRRACSDDALSGADWRVLVFAAFASSAAGGPVALSRAQIARATGLDVRSAFRCVRRLVRLGYFVPTGERDARGATIFRMCDVTECVQ